MAMYSVRYPDGAQKGITGVHGVPGGSLVERVPPVSRKLNSVGAFEVALAVEAKEIGYAATVGVTSE